MREKCDLDRLIDTGLVALHVRRNPDGPLLAPCTDFFPDLENPQTCFGCSHTAEEHGIAFNPNAPI